MQFEKSSMGGGLMRKLICVLMSVVLVCGLNPGLSRQTAWANELAPASGGGELSVRADSVKEIAGSSWGSTAQGYSPYYASRKSAISYNVYTSSEIDSTGNITKIAFKNDSATSLTGVLEIYMGTTTENALIPSTIIDPKDMTKVYSTNSCDMGQVADWEPITLNTPFNYDGAANLVVAVFHSSSETSSLKTYAGANYDHKVLLYQSYGNEFTSFEKAYQAVSEYDITQDTTYNTYRPDIQLTFGASDSGSGSGGGDMATDTFKANDSAPIITTQADLDAFVAASQSDSFAGKTITIADDAVDGLTMNTMASTNGTSVFAGTFDGNGKSIALNISDTSRAGMFKFAGTNNASSPAVIKNLVVTGSVTATGAGLDSSSNARAAGVVCVACGALKLENVGNRATVASQGSRGLYAGGLVAMAAGAADDSDVASLVIDGCYNRGSVTAAGANAGGFVGCYYYAASGTPLTISNSYNTGVVTSSTNAGGFIGAGDGFVFYEAAFANCYTIGAVSATGGSSKCGVFVGDMPANKITATNCYKTVPDGNDTGNSRNIDNVTLKSVGQLKALAGMLGNAFRNDVANAGALNNGNPILTWETADDTAVYTVMVEDAVNGAVTADRVWGLSSNDTVALTVTPDANYQLDALLVTYDTGQTIAPALTSNTNKYEFEMPAYDVTVAASFTAEASTPNAYNITKGDAANGSFIVTDGTSEITQAAEGDTVTVVPTADANYVVDEVFYTYGALNDNEALVKTTPVTAFEEGKQYIFLAEKNGKQWAMKAEESGSSLASTEAALGAMSGKVVFANESAASSHLWTAGGMANSWTLTNNEKYVTCKSMYGSYLKLDSDLNFFGGTVQFEYDNGFKSSDKDYGNGPLGISGDNNLYMLPESGATAQAYEVVSSGGLGTITKVTPVAGAYTFAMPAADVAVAVTFKSSTPTYTISGNGTLNSDMYTLTGGTYTISANEATVGTTGITIATTPDIANGYKLKSITAEYAATGGSAPVDVAIAGNNGTFTMPSGNVTVTVVFVQELGITANEATPSGSGMYKVTKNDSTTVITEQEVGEYVYIIATPASSSYVFDSATVKDANGNTVPLGTSTVSGVDAYFTMPSSAVTIDVVFRSAAVKTLNLSVDAQGSVERNFEQSGETVSLNVNLAGLSKSDGAGITQADATNLVMKWQKKASGESTWTDINGASASASWNVDSSKIKNNDTDGVYYYSASLAEVGTVQYRCVATWTVDGYETKVAESNPFTVTVTAKDTSGILTEIGTAAQLKQFAASVNKGDDYSEKTVKLTADIDMTGETAWTPIGTKSNPFIGAFDGQDHAIKNLVVTDTASTGDDSAFGLFGWVKGKTTVKNLTIDSTCSFTSSAYTVAGVVARSEDEAGNGTDKPNYTPSVQNIRNLASITSTATPSSNTSNYRYNAAAGIVGSGTCAVSNCANKGTIESASANVVTAGVYGSRSYSGSVITDCYNVGTVKSTAPGTPLVAGIATNGDNSTGTDISKCYNAGAVSAPNATNDAKVAAIATGGNGFISSYGPISCYYLESSAPHAVGEGFTGTAPTEKTSSELITLHSTLGATNWQSGTGINAAFGGYPALAWEKAESAPQRTVTFDANGGAPAPAAANVENGEKVVRPVTDPSKEGYLFKEWQLNGSAYEFDSPVTGDITLTAAYALNTADMQKAISDATTLQATVGEGKAILIAESAADVDAGKAFVTQAAKNALDQAIEAAQTALKNASDKGTSATDEDKATLASAVTMLNSAVSTFNNAKQTGAKAAQTYAITITPNANGTIVADKTSAAAGDEVTLTITPNADYELIAVTVAGTDSANPEVTVTDNKFTMPAYPVTVSATFEGTAPAVAYYTVTFDADGGAPAPEAQQVKSGESAQKPAAPAKDGYKFAGWKLNDADYDFSAAVTGNIALTASWALDVSALEDAVKLAEEAYGSGDYTVASNANDVPSGVKFVTESALQTFKNAITAAKVAEPASPEAVNEAVKTLNDAKAAFEAAKQDGTNKAQETKVENTGVEDFSAEGYALSSDEEGVEVNLEVKDETNDAEGAKAIEEYKNDIADGMAAKAVYEVNLTQTKDGEKSSLNNNAGAMKLTFPVPGVVNGTTVQVIQLHYNDQGDVETMVTYFPKVQDEKATIRLMGFLSRFIVAVPQSEPDPAQFTVTFDADGGTPAPLAQTVKEGENATQPTAPSKDGYTFGGWTLNGSSYDFSAAVTGDITLKAVWTKVDSDNQDTTDPSGDNGNNPDNNGNANNNSNNNSNNGNASSNNANNNNGNAANNSGNAANAGTTTPAAPSAGESASGSTTAKSANTLKAKAKTVKVKASKLAKKKQTVKAKKAFKVTGAQGKVTYKVSKYDKKAKKKITVSKSGKVTVKKGLPKGTYKLKVKVSAAGDDAHAPATKTVTLKVKVK